MNWFRSKIRAGSQLGLFALALQLGLSFGHFHGSKVQPALALADAKQLVLQETVPFAATCASDGASQANASGPVQLKTFSGDEPDGQAIEHCAICAVMALDHAMLVATPPYLLRPQAAAFLSLAADAEFVDPNSARVAFQPRAPPIS
jgi:hypothetical protein